MKHILAGIDCICCREPVDASRFVDIGARSECVHVTGNIKYDSLQQNTFKPAVAVPVFVAGSTWPGEEEIIISAWQYARRTVAGLKLIIAPRHSKRTKEVGELLMKGSIRFILKSQNEFDGLMDNTDTDCILVDTMGELVEAYSFASVAFVGGSLVERGGQNPLEPAAMGLPVIFGPNMGNFSEPAKCLLESCGAVMVKDADETAQVLVKLLVDDTLRKDTGRKAKETVASLGGTTERAIKILKEAKIIS